MLSIRGRRRAKPRSLDVSKPGKAHSFAVRQPRKLGKLKTDREIRGELLAHAKLERQLDRETGGDDRLLTFCVFTRDAATGGRARFRFPGLIAPWFNFRLMGIDRSTGFQSWRDYELQLRLLRSSLFAGLHDQPLAAAQWLAFRAITLYYQRKEPHWVPTLTATELRHLHGLRRQCERIERELTAMIKPVREMMSHTLSDQVDMHKDLGRAASDLKGFLMRVVRVPSRTHFSEFRKEDFARHWMLRLPAVPYALFRLLTEHSDPRILKREAYRRIGNFEQEYLGRKARNSEADTEDTVRRQVYTFRRSANCGCMDRILKRLLADKWYCLDHPLNCDWETAGGYPPLPVKKSTRNSKA